MSVLTIVLAWGPTIVLSAAYCAGGIFYFLPRFRRWPARRTFFALAVLTAGGRLLYAALASIGQFLLWTGNDLTKTLLALPADGNVPTFLSMIPRLTESSIGYFLVYSWGRFWLNPFLALGMALAFYFFLWVLKKRNARFFDEGETELGFFSALLAGWPGFAVFLPLVFVFVVLISLVRLTMLREAYTTFGIPLLLAAGTVLLLGDALIRFLGLGALWI